MKKLWIAFAIAMAALMIIASPALAWGANANVDCSDIDVTDDTPAVGTTITFSGTVTITATATRAGCGMTHAEASSWAAYNIIDPEGYIIAVGYSPLDNYTDWYWTPGQYTADASQTYAWSCDVYIDMVGEYYAIHGGEAEVYYGHWEWVCGHWEFVKDGTAYDYCCTDRQVVAHQGAMLSTARVRPYLVIQLPAGGHIFLKDHAAKFFTNDGWGDPTSDTIVYTDGVWQVEIANGTTIQLDGQWRDKTWIEVDSQGNVIGRYGSDGHIIAEEIGLSSPITVTKVG